MIMIMIFIIICIIIVLIVVLIAYYHFHNNVRLLVQYCICMHVDWLVASTVCCAALWFAFFLLCFVFCIELVWYSAVGVVVVVVVVVYWVCLACLATVYTFYKFIAVDVDVTLMYCWVVVLIAWCVDVMWCDVMWCDVICWGCLRCLRCTICAV
jgi:hypothetical protein